MRIRFPIIIFLLFWLAAPARATASTAFPLEFTDSAGDRILIQSEPRKVVSLVPAVTEMIIEIGAAANLVGITLAPDLPPESSSIELVGGFSSIDPERVAKLQPEIIFYSDDQQKIRERFHDRALLISLESGSIKKSFTNLRLLGRIFGRQDEAESVISRERKKLALIREKTAELSGPGKRIARLRGDKELVVPANGRLQHDLIKAAGGRPPSFGARKSGEPVSLEQWQQFNPEIIYGCRHDKKLSGIINKPGWKEVDAVKNNNVFFFACGLVNRAAAHSGDAVSLLAARAYTEEFSDPANYVLPEQAVEKRTINLDLDWVRQTEIVASNIHDFRNKTLILRFAEPMTVVSTLAGQRSGITTVANHYFPPPSWGLGHKKGLAGLRDHTRQVLGLKPESTAMLFTGADMDNLAVVNKRFKNLSIYALVTAGVRSNAVRMAEDAGSYYKPGTINMLLLTNRRLSPRAMTRAIISATEAKSAALADLDIRSSYTPLINQATGTGTDNIIVIQGRGPGADASGGHTRLGEHIARAVYQGVQQAVRNQNGIMQSRHILQRLRERNISLSDIAVKTELHNPGADPGASLEKLLIADRYAGFIQSALAISDAYERGLPVDLAAFDIWRRTMAEKIAGRKINLVNQAELDNLPLVIRQSFSALINGLKARQQQ